MYLKEVFKMARGNTYKCLCCEKEYVYCPKCDVKKPTYDVENFCSRTHEDIFKILSKHGCGLATAEETLDALKLYDLSNISESVRTHINTLREQTTPVKVKPFIKVEPINTVEPVIKVEPVAKEEKKWEHVSTQE
jgi:hypothetical protein